MSNIEPRVNSDIENKIDSQGIDLKKERAIHERMDANAAEVDEILSRGGGVDDLSNCLKELGYEVHRGSTIRIGKLH